VDLTNQGSPGQTAHFDVIYLPTTSGNVGNMTVATMVITSPGVHSQAELGWTPFVLLPDQAMHAGAYVSPIVSGSDSGASGAGGSGAGGSGAGGYWAAGARQAWTASASVS
jgi:hypothetical protein